MKNKNVLVKDLQQSPFTVLIEPTEGCNLGCSFCGLRGMREKGTKPWNHMNLKIAERIASEISKAGWNSKIVFAQHGEPTLNPKIFEIIKIFRKNLPDAVFHMYTNGYGINNSENKEKYLKNLFDSGINNLIVDCYSDEGDWNFINEIKGDWNIVFHNKGIPLYTNNKKERILLLPPIKDDHKITRKLANHCGAAAPLNLSYNKKRCTMPFRELAFRYDGNVSLCCDDFRGEYPIANINDMGIVELWNHERFQAARIMLYNYSRDFKPCSGCTNMSMRVGFLPDSSGQKDLPEISSEAKNMAKEVSKFGPLSSIIIKRKWEK